MATGNVVFVRFTSQPVIGGSLFRLRWDSIPQSSAAITPSGPTGNLLYKLVTVIETYHDCLIEVCGGDIFISENNGTVITSPGFPNGYADNLNCLWRLSTDPHFRISLKMNILDMEAYQCQFDRVEVNEGMI